ncbi:hypothetical protein SULAR_02233 [Sulfurovum sp. AR]|nr:SMI1/KNR4 family protein [Sulfurovum sp. AR]EIF51644.1 hypothetical protein SULAR_02233 [Sulfurovum sp. AR]
MENPFRVPTDQEIQEAQEKLNYKFHPDYIEFLKSGSDVANACFEPAVILSGSCHLDIYEISDTAWSKMGLSRDLLPIVEDNGDYYCLNKSGEVVFWSHNGTTDEKWKNISDWYQQVCVELN